MFRNKTNESSSGSRLCTNSSCRGPGRQLSKRTEQHGAGRYCHHSKPLDQPWTGDDPGKSSSRISNAFGLSKSRYQYYTALLWKPLSDLLCSTLLLNWVCLCCRCAPMIPTRCTGCCRKKEEPPFPSLSVRMERSL